MIGTEKQSKALTEAFVGQSAAKYTSIEARRSSAERTRGSGRTHGRRLLWSSSTSIRRFRAAVLSLRTAGSSQRPIVSTSNDLLSLIVVQLKHLNHLNHLLFIVALDRTPATNLKVRLGDYNLRAHTEQLPHEEFGVRRKVVNEAYNPATYQNDIALLELSSEVTYREHIIPICLPNKGLNAPSLDSYLEIESLFWSFLHIFQIIIPLTKGVTFSFVGHESSLHYVRDKARVQSLSSIAGYVRSNDKHMRDRNTDINRQTFQQMIFVSLFVYLFASSRQINDCWLRLSFFDPKSDQLTSSLQTIVSSFASTVIEPID